VEKKKREFNGALDPEKPFFNFYFPKVLIGQSRIWILL